MRVSQPKESVETGLITQDEASSMVIANDDRPRSVKFNAYRQFRSNTIGSIQCISAGTIKHDEANSMLIGGDHGVYFRVARESSASVAGRLSWRIRTDPVAGAGQSALALSADTQAPRASASIAAVSSDTAGRSRAGSLCRGRLAQGPSSAGTPPTSGSSLSGQSG
jgi:hypothetical protein